MTIEAESYLPFVPQPDEIEWTLDEPVGFFVPMFNFQTAQRVRYGTGRWRARIRYSRLSYEQRAVILAFVARVGSHRAFWVTDMVNDRQGETAAPELITNGNVAATWSGDTGRTVTTDSDGVRVTKSSGTTSGIGLASPVTVVNGATYALRMVRHHQESEATIQSNIRAGSTQFASNYGAGTLSAIGGRQVASCTMGGTSAYVGAADSLVEAGNWSTPAWYVLRGMSLVRALEVDGGSSPTLQYGSGVYVKSGETSVAGAVKAGDMLELVSLNQDYAQMVRAVEDVSTDSSGKGFLRFEPTARGAMVVNDLIALARPQCRMIIAEPVAELTTPPRYASDLELSCVEVF